ncbi:DUF302 domain-containing protein [Helicobacter mustelae]|uniref:DUF302 domain-containing protein n=1 Tax=Helicobacter mustelae (strain ATCC 43772 / CCUG 25715 / CIP 103759 / LMG 18044 / NCTC 12198 / R85-136P) TaxID=679897 RepID=D3UIY6_HELM1|nr:DUF302 domain-containing protein [Helicobacter mustelae]CBG40461.1 putative hypothetical protein [Helicobacter mustelae 12198]SQH71961.1 Uncharacterized conserved protein [Helicobacter mustelae]STP13104.1 Uncharacterized conserved protein [Helicobacter mustelae]
MKNLFYAIILVFGIAGTISAKEGGKVVQSKQNFETTYENIEKFLKEKNIAIFAEFKHSDWAKDVGEPLNPTKVIVFGNPKVGTALMRENQKIAIELPLKIAIWQDKSGKVFVSATDIRGIAKKYGIKNQKVIDNIAKLLEQILQNATK